MFSPIQSKRSFKLLRNNGSVVAFNTDTLVDYIVATGDFTDPETRVPFTDSELEEIDKRVRLLFDNNFIAPLLILRLLQAEKLKLNKPSVLNLKKNPQAFSDFKFRRDALSGTIALYLELSL
jgi:hypothetical protein